MDIKKIKNIIEALLVISETGLTRDEIKNAIPESDTKDIDEGIRLLREEYDSDNRAFNISEIAGRYRLVTKSEYMPWIGNLYKKEAERLTGPSLETLAILAYKQPATRAEIEIVRGVNVGGVLKSLLEKGLIQVKGRKDVIGRPLVYGTTERFLELFGLNSLNDLPGLRDFSEDDLEYGKKQEHILPVEDMPGGQETLIRGANDEENTEVEESTVNSQKSTEGGEVEEAEKIE